MPDDIAVGGDGDALIHEAELRIKADEPFFAGEHDALAPGGFRVGADLTQNTGGAALVPVGRSGDDAEYHLPPTLRRVEMGVIVHLIGEVGHIGKTWSLGDKMMITIVRADVNLGKIDFEVAPAAKN